MTTNYQRRPGEGALFFVKQAAAGTSLWSGALTLKDGTEARINAKVIKPEGKKHPHWECEVRRIGQQGEAWDKLADFKMKAFGGVANKAQDVLIPSVGKCKAWVRQSGDTQFIKLQLLDAPKGAVVAP